ncbi:hypothetical protein F5X68DRAFT_618 [Plectosphaerella plurivora]|uniref:Uncharacterized protein n=1 Tax=Plectosphaerella plurivora TaxID=936078 RepID=A0A9P8VM00_9PEZI|nr:hypothetical protein F5X68DRAFT_618 [Plectosphaerella plurivora]
MEYTSLGVEQGGSGGGPKSGPLAGGWELRALPRVPDANSKHYERSTRDARYSGLNAYDLAADFICVALPLGLLSVLIAVASLDGTEAEPRALSRWQNAISILATLFPMFFASVVGRMVYEVARWKLEKGASLGALEQLLGSRTFGGTLITQLHLPAYNLLGLGLILVWAFSPLGAQSVLRVLESPLEGQFSTANVQYQDLTKSTELGRTSIASAGSAKASRAKFKYLGTMFSTLLQVPTDVQKDTMDLWGNVRIPRLGDAPNSGEWHDITWSDNVERFASLAGVPVGSVPVGNNTLEIETAYIDLDCTSVKKNQSSPNSVDMEWDWPSFWTATPRPLVPERGNGSWQGIGNNQSQHTSAGMDLSTADRTSWGIALDRFVDTYWINGTTQYAHWGIKDVFNKSDPDRNLLEEILNSPALLTNETGIEAGPTQLFFQAYVDDNSLAAGYKLDAYCGVKQRYVETRVHCRLGEASARKNCTAVAHRPSQKTRPPEDISFLSFPEVFLQLATRMPMATNVDMGAGDTVVRWLDALNLTSTIPSGLGMFTNVDEASFGRRLSQVLNSYIFLSNLGSDYDDGVLLYPNATAEVAVSTLVPVYRVARPWIALAFICCVVLLAGGVLSVVFAHLAHGPEVLGYASSIVRDSKLMDMPADVGTMSGVEISREMRDLRLRYGYSELTLTGRRLTGVGREHETAPI